ncbi:YdhW family putative oxidoreductase system protein [Citrobacter portucalensis]|uniref:YdhW family putative oxidoreductase system protein n=1 Tax=Citrobacter portucalensis TaxID=1639133 RepID=UPI0015FD9570|nr:YdhW family putative oxidoreductase system protein [Citrobacter portucalensis]MBA7975039.1 YdhW family putative oxidoreductase system protein [Citrobacter freundii]MCX8990442.1 YdhW family putative oxidoreductase system protein [Citrobacter portucalensis]MCX9005750.1 YdhW family putative oxidoreductase system protein [Citrobacter portucalensis]
MTNVSNVQAPVGALPDEVDSQKRHWLQAFHPPVERVTAPQVQEAASPESIVADFIRQHSASGHLVARSVFLQPPYSVPEADLSALLGVLCQDANNADITRVQGAEDVYFYSTQTMTANYAGMCVQVVENDICRAIAEAVRFDCQTYPRPYKVAMLTQPPYSFESQQISAALTAMETHPDYADIRTVESSNAEPYLFSERFMSYGKAYGLCEWLEVEQYQNP